MTDVSWVLPVSVEAYKRREDIKSAWDKFSSWLLGKKKQVAFTGMRGIGKTVLFDYMTFEAYKPGYICPTASKAVETRLMVAKKTRINISVIPGQDSDARLLAMDNLFLGKSPIDGVVHVVANGFATTRDEVLRSILIKDLNLATIESYRLYQMQKEIDDLQSTCQAIRRAIHKHKRPIRMLIAVAKLDLYYNFVDEAKNYYSPYGTSKFIDVLRELQRKVGEDHFSWDVLPVCAWLEDFTWNQETRVSSLKPNQRDHFLALFTDGLTQFCQL